jgi:DNA-binding NarL/FixJ family response regulator
MAEPLSVVIVDKNPIVRAGVQALVDADARFTVPDTHADGAAFLKAAAKAPCDIVVSGWMLTDMDAGELMRALAGLDPAPRLIVYTGARTAHIPATAMKLGAWGFCSKSAPPDELMATLHAVAGGRMSFPYIDVARLAADPLTQLTPRETELLAALAEGWSNQQIANRFGISANTVKFHLKNLYDKLSVKNRAMAVAMYVAARAGEE